MRTFFSLREAAREIRRDIYKAPAINSSRVQSVANQDFRTNEWTNYSYSIDLKGMPDNFDEFLDTACEMMPFWAQVNPVPLAWTSYVKQRPPKMLSGRLLPMSRRRFPGLN